MSQQALPQTRHYSADDVKIIDKSAGYDGFFKVNVYRLQHRLFAGGWNQPIVRELFERLVREPRLMSDGWAEGLDGASDDRVARRVCDYIAGMTDRFAADEHARFVGGTPDLRLA